MSEQDLELALELDDMQAVGQLLPRLSHGRSQLQDPVSLLHMAVNIGHIRTVAYLLDQQPYATDADVKDPCYGRTPLMYAVANNDLDMTRFLISTGRFNLDAKNVSDQTVLHIAAASEETSRDVLVLLIESGADVEAEDMMLRTPFLTSIEENNLSVAQLLYSFDCNIYKITIDHQTALHLAVSSGNCRMICWLVEIGCPVNATDVNYHTPLMTLVQEKKHSEIIHQIMTSLLRAEASPNYRDKDGSSVFLHAVGNQFSITSQHLQLLIENGANIDLADHTSLSPLWQAVFDVGHYPNRADVVQLLVSHNCQLDTTCCGKLLFTSGQHSIFCYETPITPFEVALDSGCYGIAQFLWFAGCHVPPEVRHDYCHQSVVPAELYWLKQLALQNVYGLKHLCCINLRKILGRQIHNKVQCLPIPRRLKSYLLLEDLPFSVEGFSKQ